MNTVKYVSIGDHVKAVLNSRLNMNTLKNETPVYTFKVTEIHETYGYRIVNGKKELNTPVISGIPLNDETKKCSCHSFTRDGNFIEDCTFCKGTGIVETVGCNLSYVTEILHKEKSVKGKIKNIFKDQHCFVEVTKNTISGPTFSQLIIYVLKNLNMNITRAINFEKAYQLYKKNPIGLIQIKQDKFYDEDLFIVNKKRFKKWVTKNIHALYEKVETLHQSQNKFEKEYEKQYWNDVEKEFYNNDFDHDHEDEFDSCCDYGLI